MNGGPGAIRTPDPFVRSEVLYPAELRARDLSIAMTVGSGKSGHQTLVSRRWREKISA